MGGNGDLKILSFQRIPLTKKKGGSVPLFVTSPCLWGKVPPSFDTDLRSRRFERPFPTQESPITKWFYDRNLVRDGIIWPPFQRLSSKTTIKTNESLSFKVFEKRSPFACLPPSLLRRYSHGTDPLENLFIITVSVTVG